MKRIILFALLTLPVIANAQFSLTINGFVSSNDSSKNYIVYEYTNIPKEKLYINVLKFITSNFKSAKDVVSKVDNEVISLNAFQPKQIYAKTQNYDINYNLVVSFKDNKIKIDKPIFECTTFAYGKTYRLIMSGSNGGFGSEVTIGLFKKDGKQNQEKTITYIESFINGLCNQIKTAASDSNNSDEW